MKKTFQLLTGILICCCQLKAQDVQQALKKATEQLLNDTQMKHALLGFYVEDSTGNAIYKYNSEIGMSPASSQKIFTSIAAFELLDSDYRYKTEISYDGLITDSILTGNIYITGYGDPTLGSWRYASTKPAIFFETLLNSLKSAGITSVEGDIILDNSRYSYQPIPGGWVWDDIGNYYGAGCWGLNWNENQYDLLLKPGKKEGDEAVITGTKPEMQMTVLNNFITTGKTGSSDNSYIYLSPYSLMGFTQGSVPPGKSFTISGSIPNPSYIIGSELKKFLDSNNFSCSGNIKAVFPLINAKPFVTKTNLLNSYTSPALDSIVYWFLQKSVNLYGEALVKTMAYEKNGFGSTEDGVEVLKKFWKQKGIEGSAINIIDGSGLSPQNHVTTHALVQALKFAKTRPWFNSFYKALPFYNNIKMKSGTISGCKAFAGYNTSKKGKRYTFAIIINNYNGSVNSIVQKMFNLLNELK